jgi:hypothetical protein
VALREELMLRFSELGQVPSEEIVQEVIRQMEWARTLHGEQWRGDGRDGTRHMVDLGDEPTTLAPPDWKP